MSLLLDTSVLGRLANVDDPQHSTAVRALVNLHRLGEVVSITAQNLVEFRSAATRASNLNGLGLSIAGAEALATTFETGFPLLAETPAIFPAWKAIVTTMGVVGKQVHDARFVAVCHVHGVSGLLTYDVSHFLRLSNYGPGLRVIDPASV